MPGEFPSLATLGPRICIIGPSTSGKSTLADAMARKTGLPLVHLDQLHHYPATRWQMRPREEFHQLHDQAIQGTDWIIEGNYGSCLPQRMARATGVIMLDICLPQMLYRYTRRTLSARTRIGGILPDNQRDRLSWEMYRYLMFTAPGKRKQQHRLFKTLTLPKIYLASPAETARYSQWWLR